MRERGYGRFLFLEWPPFVVGLSQKDFGSDVRGGLELEKGAGIKRHRSWKALIIMKLSESLR